MLLSAATALFDVYDLTSKTSGLPFGEFVTLTALMISLVALSIDAMLPALPEIAGDLGAQGENARQHIITSLFLGMGLATIFYGPLSDSFGRKPTIYAGFAIFVAGCLISVFAMTYDQMLAGRFLQGVGAAGPRIVTIAIVRDQYQGDAMARIMSLVMSVFIMVPAVAPAMGQGVLLFAGWRAIFIVFLVLTAIAWIWFALRQPETLKHEHRAPFSVAHIRAAVIEVCSNRTALGYTLAAGLIFGAFVGYLNSSQQILQEQYSLGTRFPLYFAVLALAIGCASLVNARLVMRFGMRALSRWAVLGLSTLSLAFLLIAWHFAGSPPLWALMTYLVASFFTIGILFGNFNALAMEPLGHIAGLAAAVIGSLTTLMSLLLGAFIGGHYDGTVLPLVAGFALMGTLSSGVVYWTERSAPHIA